MHACWRMNVTKHVCERCIYAYGVLSSHTKLTKRNRHINIRVCNSKFSQKETQFVTAYTIGDNKNERRLPDIRDWLDPSLGRFRTIINWIESITHESQLYTKMHKVASLCGVKWNWFFSARLPITSSLVLQVDSMFSMEMVYYCK